MRKTYDGIHNLHLNDEAPTIGTGRRRVRVRIGGGLVTLRCVFSQSYRTMGKTEFEELAKSRNNQAEFAHLFEEKT